jgi:hypothetical protein
MTAPANGRDDAAGHQEQAEPAVGGEDHWGVL